MGSKPKEDPADKAARLRERRTASIERTEAASATAQGLTQDLNAVYGRRLPSLFSLASSAAAVKR